MASTAISYGVEVWLADLQRSGWTLTVTERRELAPATTLRCVEDDFQPLDLLAPVRQFGVLATRSSSGPEVEGGDALNNASEKSPEAQGPTLVKQDGRASGPDSLSGVFVPCSSEVEAWRLLERIEEEA